MEIVLNFNVLIHFLCAFLGFLSGFILLYYGIKSNRYNQPLAIGQIVSSLAIFVIFLLVSKLMFFLPFMYRMGNVFTLIFLPLPFLNVAFHTKNRLWRWSDLLHFIPLMIYLADYGHVLLMSNEQKLEILREELNNLDLLGQFRQSKYFGPGFHERFRAVMFSFYWVAQIVLLVRWVKNQKNLSYQKRVWKNWTIVFLIFQFFMFLPVYLSFLGFGSMGSYHMINSSLPIWLLFSSISLFFFPSILYGNGFADKRKEFKTSKTTTLPEVDYKKLQEVMAIIVDRMDKHQLFLKQGYSINDFSKDIDLPVYQISKSINTFKELGFSEYVNQKRIQYCIKTFMPQDWQTYSIEAIALKCGFSNRNTFTRAFKKFEGSLPSEFLKRAED